MNTLTQCWFCHQINLTSRIEGDDAHCLRCGLLIGTKRAETSAMGLLPEQPLIAPTVGSAEQSLPDMPVPYLAPPVTPAPRAYVPELDDATQVAPMQQVWGLTTEHGDYIPLLSDVVVVGRKPVATPDATPLPIPDPTRTLSKTHARLCRDAASDTWAIEDLGSTNGVTMYDETMTQQMSLTPGVPVVATSFIVLGTMRVRLQRHSTVAAVAA